MKFNFRKIASVIASTVMLSSTVALAAASSFPAPFVKTGAADVAVVYGAGASVDLVAVLDVTTKLQSSLASQTATSGTSSGVSTSGGDSVLMATGSTKLNIGKNLTDVRSTQLDSADMASLLAKKTYQAKDGSNYDYEQYIKIAPNLQFGLFADVDFDNRMPTLGISRPSNSPILNYTLSFTKTVESAVSTAGRMTDVENTDISILGKSYKLLNAYNNSNIKLELMTGAASDTISLDEEKTYTVGGKDFKVKLIYVDATNAKFTINGQDTLKMSVGSTQKLSDGTQVGVRDVLYQSFAGGVMKAEFSLGAEKLTLEDGQKLKLNDNNVNDVVVDIIEGSGSTGKRTISKIVLQWISNDKTFIAEGKDKTFPGLNSVTFKVANITRPTSEELSTSNSGDKTLQIKMPLKSGMATIPVLSLNSSGSGISKLGGDSTGTNLVTGISEINFNRTTDQYFVASWASGTDAESYLLKISSVTRDSPSTGLNSTVITNAVTSDAVCSDKKAADTCTIGNVVLNINAVDVNGNGWVNITAGSGVSFNKAYTPGGFTVWLPVLSTTTAATATNKLVLNTTVAPTTFSYTMEEADKSKNLGSGKDVNFTVGIASNKIEVSVLTDTGFSGGDKFDLGGSSTISKYVAYLTGELGTKLVYDTKPDQNTLDIFYAGGESYGNVFLTAPETLVTDVGGVGGSVSDLGSVSVTDAEVASVSGKNLIVVGGSCVNSVAAKLLGGALCGADFETSTKVGAGSFLIQTFDAPYTTGKVATLVAGYNAGDTVNAAKYLTTQLVDTTAGKKYVGTSATSAMLQTEQSSVSTTV